LAAKIDDLSFEVGKILTSLDLDEGRLEEAQSRLFGYQDLFRKHGVQEVKALINEKARLKSELEWLESGHQKLRELIHLIRMRIDALQVAGRALTESRKQAGRKIKKQVEAELHELVMPGAVFSVEFFPLLRSLSGPDLTAFGREIAGEWEELTDSLARIGESGAERGQFFLSPNPGGPSLPLERIASGGELSRIMLALKKALAADAETCVLVFDEIDAGISGRIADVVGKKMRELASDFQVICISHLPQVAVYADAHFCVKKQRVEKGRTESCIIKLSLDESAREIARLLSGAEVSEPSLKNARNLIAKAKELNSQNRSGPRA